VMRWINSCSFDCAPYFAVNGEASTFAKATVDKSQGKQGRQDKFRRNAPPSPFGLRRAGRVAVPLRRVSLAQGGRRALNKAGLVRGRKDDVKNGSFYQAGF